MIESVHNNYLHLNYYFKVFIQHIFSEWPEKKSFLGLSGNSKGMDYIQEQLMPPTKTWKAPRDIPTLLTFFFFAITQVRLFRWSTVFASPLIIFTNVLEKTWLMFLWCPNKGIRFWWFIERKAEGNVSLLFWFIPVWDWYV